MDEALDGAPVKIMIVGDYCVGKTCFALRYMTGSFPEPGQYYDDLLPLKSKRTLVDSKTFDVTLADYKDNEDYGHVGFQMTAQETDAFLVCFSLNPIAPEREFGPACKTSEMDESLSALSGGSHYNIRHWLQAFNRMRYDVPVVLVGLKRDLRDGAQSEKPVYSPASYDGPAFLVYITRTDEPNRSSTTLEIAPSQTVAELTRKYAAIAGVDAATVTLSTEGEGTSALLAPSENALGRCGVIGGHQCVLNARIGDRREKKARDESASRREAFVSHLIREPSAEERLAPGRALARELGAHSYLECSAKNGAGVREVVEEAIRAVVRDRNRKESLKLRKKRCKLQ